MTSRLQTNGVEERNGAGVKKGVQTLFSFSSLTFPSPLLFSFSFSEMSFQVFNRKVAKEVGALRGEVRSGGRGTWDQGWMKRSERV